MKDSPLKTDVRQIEIPRLDQITGQFNAINTLKVHLGAYLDIFSATVDIDLPFGPVILSGPLGTGKTFVAKSVHHELGYGLWVQTDGIALNNSRSLSSTLLNADASTTICIDNAHEMNSMTQHILMSAISKGTLPIPTSHKQPHNIVSLNNFRLILATAHEYLLTPTLRQQIKINCRFDYYSVKDIATIVQERTAALDWQFESKSIPRMIANRSKGTVKQAIDFILQMSWEVSRYYGHDAITVPDVYSAFNYMKIDELGLDYNDRRYLHALDPDNHVSIITISSKLGLPPKIIEELIEPYLIRENFVTVDRHSMRILTGRGMDYIRPDLPRIPDEINDEPEETIPF